MVSSHKDERPQFGPWLKARRLAFGFTRKELAAMAGCSEVTIVKIETGERRPSEQIAGLLAQVLDIPAEERPRFVEFARLGSRRPAPLPTLPHVGAPEMDTRSRPVGNLPSPPTSFVGRDQEIASARALLESPEVRLLTFTGSPGIGKTRMSLRLGEEVAGRFAGGAIFVGLASLRDAAALPAALARAVSVRESADTPLLQAVKEHLRGKQLLLLLDNFEQLMAAAPVLGELLASSPALKIVVSSREALRVYGEHRFPVEPLSLPEAGEALRPVESARYGAVRLFVERAVAAEPSFALTEANASLVIAICRGLQGVPLAIELAAARTWELSLEEIRAGLDSKLSLLTEGPIDLPARQQSLRGAIDWSYDLLSGEERLLFRRLSVFAGGCTWNALEEVCGEQGAGGRPHALAESLVRKSLLQHSTTPSLTAREDSEQHPTAAQHTTYHEPAHAKEDTGDQTELPRLSMLETIREYALERLVEGGEAEALRLRHARYYLALAEAAEPFWRGPQQAVWFRSLEREHDNLRAALDWSAVGEEARRVALGLRLAGALGRFWEFRGYPGEGRAYLQRLLALPHSPGNSAEGQALRMKALGVAGRLALYQGDFPAARAMYEESLSICRELGDKSSIAAKLNDLGVAVRAGGDYAYARALYEESLHMRRELGDLPGIASSLNSLGTVLLALGDYPRARALAEESLNIRRESGDKAGIALCVHNLGEIERSLGNYAAAGKLYEESLQLSEELGDKPGVANALHNQGQVALHDRRAETAEALFEQALAAYREWGDKPGIAECLAGLAEVAVLRGEAGRAAMLFGAAGALLEATGFRLSPPDLSRYEQSRALAREQLGEEAFNRRESEGRRLALDDALERALSTSG